jgi:inner membrane protein
MLAIGAFVAVAPDADVVAFRFGIPYEHVLGHRGLSHSLVVAACVGGLAAWWASWRGWPRSDGARLAAFLFLATASHGMLDAMTDGGLGVAFLAPFSSERWFFPWRPIRVSPLSVGGLFSTRGLAIIESELVVVWLPAAAVAAVVLALEHRSRRRAVSSE